MQRNIDARKDASQQGAQKHAKLRTAIELENYEFNAHGVELGQRHRLSAIVPDGSPEPRYARDPELYYHPATWPGARLPRCGLEHERRKVSTHDLADKGQFVLFTGIGGEPWREAAAEASARAGVRIATYVIGPGREVLDTYGDWQRLSAVMKAAAYWCDLTHMSHGAAHTPAQSVRRTRARHGPDPRIYRCRWSRQRASTRAGTGRVDLALAGQAR